ncbi:MAG: hypothetical protein ABI895_03895 [Deltaproteobacteria bacterium]
MAIDVNIGHRLGGVEGAVALTRKHAKRGLDPELVERFSSVAAEVCKPLDDPERSRDGRQGLPGHARAPAGDDSPGCALHDFPVLGARMCVHKSEARCRSAVAAQLDMAALEWNRWLTAPECARSS